MELGKKVKTSLGDCTVLYSHDKYLILFTGDKFIKANGYIIRDDNYVFWNGGEYYNSFIELALDIAELVDKSI